MLGAYPPSRGTVRSLFILHVQHSKLQRKQTQKEKENSSYCTVSKQFYFQSQHDGGKRRGARHERRRRR